MLYLNIQPIIKARGIERPYTFLVKAGFTPHTATSLIQGTLRSFHLDHVERLCLVLNCEPNDLLLWMPEKDKIYPVNNALNVLKSDKTPTPWKEILTQMTYKELLQSTNALQPKDPEAQ